MHIGRIIADLRSAHGLSQDQLAGLLFVSRDLVSKWENETRRPDFPMIGRIADALGVPVDAIIGKDEYLFDELEDCLPDNMEITADGLAVVLNAFLKDLPPHKGELFIQRYYLLKSTSEIASAYGIKENQVRSRLSKTRKKLKNYIKENVT